MTTAEYLSQPNESPRWMLRSQLLIAVNLPLAIIVIVFLFYDYERELNGRVEDKRIALEEEAKTILPAVSQLINPDLSNVQKYLDAVCGRMQEEQSPGHHIAVKVGESILQAHAHHRESAGILQAMQKASRSSGHRAHFGSTELVVGMYEQGNIFIYVSETIDNIYQSVSSEILQRIAGLAVLALIAAIVVNLILLRVVTRPLNKLVATVRTIGQGELGVQSDLFRSLELNFLANEINVMSESLTEADREHKAQMSKAREIQHNLLPGNDEVPGFNVALLFQPADDVGGDYYDVLSLSDGTQLFCVADVTGHGVSAAMNATMLKTLLMHATELFTSPSAIMNFVNQRFISLSLEGDFVTVFLARIDAETRKLEYANAGHEPAWLVSSTGDIQELSSTGMILGIDETAECDQATVEMNQGDRLFIVTDGVTETHNNQNEMFGRNKIDELFVESQQYPMQEIIDRLDKALILHRGGAAQTDDVTAVLIELRSEKQFI